jgi:hypothetical protein
LRCPHPTMEGLQVPPAGPAESGNLWSESAPCQYVFGRAYDLRRHLRAVHGIVLDKETVDGWARRIRVTTGRSARD